MQDAPVPEIPSFVTCRVCQKIQWFTPEYRERFKPKRCSRCGIAGNWRDGNVYATFSERVYLLRWFVWQQWYVNRAGTPGADPYWYWKPHLLWKVLHYGATIMRHYNRFEPGEDHERPRNIATMRAELSQRDSDADTRFDKPAMRVSR